MSLVDVIGNLNADTYIVQRHALATYDGNGRYTRGALTTFSIIADIQPVASQLEDLPEGQRGGRTLLVLTATKLRTRDATGEPDILIYEGEPHEVTVVDEWKAFGDVHYECIIQRKVKGAGGNEGVANSPIGAVTGSATGTVT